MFEDPKKELQRLQEKLLEEEAWFDKELEAAKAMIGDAPKKPAPKPQSGQKTRKPDPKVRNYANGYGEKRPPVRNTEMAKTRKGIGGLVVLALLETAGIVGVVAYWMLFLLK